jgi:hypothetical protein
MHAPPRKPFLSWDYDTYPKHFLTFILAQPTSPCWVHNCIGSGGRVLVSWFWSTRGENVVQERRMRDVFALSWGPQLRSDRPDLWKTGMVHPQRYVLGRLLGITFKLFAVCLP